MQVVDRAFDVLEYLAQAPNPVGPTQIAQATGMHKSTVYRLLSSMKSRGYVQQLREGYVLGVGLIALASQHINSLELQTEARPFLQELQNELQLLVHLGILDKDEVVYLEKIDNLPNLRVYAQIGMRVPAYCSSLGKCLLASLSGDELEYNLYRCKFERYTPNTITNFQDLFIQLREIRHRGWALDNEEYIVGNRCVAAPIYDYRGEVIAAVSASGPKNRLEDRQLEQIAAKVTGCAQRISARLCYQQ